jgi:ArsR family transcriptional regulator
MKSTRKPLDMVMLFNALADRTRLRLLNLMRDGEVCVCFFVDALETNQPKISRHLAYLRRAGIVAARREGKWMHYTIIEPPDPAAVAILREVLQWMEEDPQMQRDREHLVSVCCAPQLPVQLEGAPIPVNIQRKGISLSA